MPTLQKPAKIHLWTGDFASQQLAFAHLLDVADKVGASLDLDQVEIIQLPEAARRLAPYFVGELPIVPNATTVLLATPPGSQCPFKDTNFLRFLGSFEGRVTRAGSPWA